MKHPDGKNFQPLRVEVEGNPAVEDLPALLDQVHGLGKVFFSVDDVCTVETHPLPIDKSFYIACHFPKSCAWDQPPGDSMDAEMKDESDKVQENKPEKKGKKEK